MYFKFKQYFKAYIQTICKSLTTNAGPNIKEQSAQPDNSTVAAQPAQQPLPFSFPPMTSRPHLSYTPISSSSPFPLPFRRVCAWPRLHSRPMGRPHHPTGPDAEPLRAHTRLGKPPRGKDPFALRSHTTRGSAGHRGAATSPNPPQRPILWRRCILALAPP
jgi:hypothetical protein